MKEIKIYEIPNIDFIERIDDPYIGMIFYVADIDTYYSVKTLKEINGINMKGSKVVEYVIDEYADFGTGSGGGSGLTATQLSNIAKIPAIKSTVDALPNNYASKNHNHSEYASSSHRHDASEIDNLPSGGATNVNFHTHNNKAILDSITQDNINSWNEKVVTTPSGQVVYKAPIVNLFNYTTVQQDTVNGVTGYYSDYINYDASKKYVTNMPWLAYKYFDSDKNYIHSQQLNAHNSGNYSIIPTISDSTVKYIRLYFGASMPNWVNNSHFVEEGTAPLLDYSKTYTTKNRWFGKKLLVLGDSISTERAGLSDITYATQLGIEYGFSSVTNLSISGKTFLWHIENLNKYSNDYDLVIVMCGTNDHGYNTTIGDINSTDNSTISGRVDMLINALIEKNLEALIVFLTPIKRVGTIGAEDEALNTTDGYYTKLGTTAKEVGEAIKNKCKQYSIPCIDLYDSIEPKLASIRNKYYVTPNDGTHPNTLGHAKYISPKVVSEIGRLAPFPSVSINTSTEVYGNIVTNPSSLSLNSGERGSFNVKLDKAPTNEQTISIESTNSNITLSTRELRFTSDNYNNEQTVTVTVPPSVTNNFTISLTNPNVVNKSVEVIITNSGTTNISVNSVSLDKGNITLTVGNTEQLTPTISPSNATNKEVNWSCNNDNCTVVNGLVTAVKEGSSIITVTTVDGNKTANCNVTVNANASSAYNEYLFDFTKLGEGFSETTVTSEQNNLNMDLSEFIGKGTVVNNGLNFGWNNGSKLKITDERIQNLTNHNFTLIYKFNKTNKDSAVSFLCTNSSGYLHLADTADGVVDNKFIFRLNNFEEPMYKQNPCVEHRPAGESSVKYYITGSDQGELVGKDTNTHTLAIKFNTSNLKLSFFIDGNFKETVTTRNYLAFGKTNIIASHDMILQKFIIIDEAISDSEIIDKMKE